MSSIKRKSLLESETIFPNVFHSTLRAIFHLTAVGNMITRSPKGFFHNYMLNLKNLPNNLIFKH